MHDPPQQPKPIASTDDRADEPRVVKADELFQGTREIVLELDGIRYRLRITRRNKLILQK